MTPLDQPTDDTNLHDPNFVACCTAHRTTTRQRSCWRIVHCWRPNHARVCESLTLNGRRRPNSTAEPQQSLAGPNVACARVGLGHSTALLFVVPPRQQCRAGSARILDPSLVRVRVRAPGHCRTGHTSESFGPNHKSARASSLTPNPSPMIVTIGGRSRKAVLKQKVAVVVVVAAAVVMTVVACIHVVPREYHHGAIHDDPSCDQPCALDPTRIREVDHVAPIVPVDLVARDGHADRVVHVDPADLGAHRLASSMRSQWEPRALVSLAGPDVAWLP